MSSLELPVYLRINLQFPSVRLLRIVLCFLIKFPLVILILRIYGLYLGNKYILGFLLCLLSGQIIVMGWAIHFGIRECFADK